MHPIKILILITNKKAESGKRKALILQAFRVLAGQNPTKIRLKSDQNLTQRFSGKIEKIDLTQRLKRLI